MADKKPYIVRRSRPQTVDDQRDISNLKRMKDATVSSSSLLRESTLVSDMSEGRCSLRKSTSSTNLNGHRASASQAVDSMNKQEMRKHRFYRDGKRNNPAHPHEHSIHKNSDSAPSHQSTMFCSEAKANPSTVTRDQVGEKRMQKDIDSKRRSPVTQERDEGNPLPREKEKCGFRNQCTTRSYPEKGKRNRAYQERAPCPEARRGYTKEHNLQDMRSQNSESTEPRPEHARKDSHPQQRVTHQRQDRRTRRNTSQHDEDVSSKTTTLYVRIHDVIKDMEVLGRVLTAKLNKPGVELTPVETSITWSDKYTYCPLTCDCQQDAMMLKDLLLKDRTQFHPLVDCSFDDYEEHKQLKDQRGNTKQQRDKTAAKERLQKQVQYEINSLSERSLSKHRQTMQEVEKTIESSKSKLRDLYTHKVTSAEIAALESKLDELEKQRAEFETAVEGFKTKLSTLFEGDSYEKDVPLLRKQIGVESRRLAKALPMYARRQDIIQLIQQHPVSILLAETGSGKSTQVVQYLLEAGFAEKGTIVCTQPRKVAVVSLADHVAEELATNVGQMVGYKAGLRVKMSPSTKVLYMTDHALLNECLTDPDLKTFSCVVVDEAHERNLYTDLLLTMIKRCMKKRSDLKVIITSATIDPQVFMDFFGSCPVMRVSGRAFPVDVVWQDSASEENEFENYMDAAVNKVVEIHRKEPAGDILVFLTSATEIEKCCDMTQQKLKDRTDFQCLPLHGQLMSEEQQKVFKPLDKNMRKIVYATNCAETSITIDGIKYVVDTGVAKEMLYDAKKSVNSLVVTTISQSSAEQRKGRAGRTAAGKCYRLYSRRSYQTMSKISLPEILKIHLGHALLKLAELGFTPDMYDFVQSPGQDAIGAALKTLHQLGALDIDDNITEVGRWIVRLPFDPRLGLMTFNAYRSGLLYDAIVLASVMSTGGGLFYRGTSEADRGKLDKAKLKFSHQGGDGLSSLEAYKVWQAVDERQKNKWCMANSINAKAIRGVRDTVKDILQVLRKDNIEVDRQFSDAEDAADKLRKMIFQCNATSLCHYLGKDKAGYFAAQASRQVHFHPSSTLCALASYPQWVVYDQLLKTSRDFITGITPVDDDWLQEMSGEQYGFELEQVRQKKLEKVFAQAAGSHSFFAMVGPRYTMLREYEAQCSADNVSGNVIVIEGNREVGELKVLSTGTSETVDLLRKKLTQVVEEAVKEVKQEVKEISVGSEEAGLRVLVGQGGQVTDILMPHETRKIFITNPSDDATQETIKEKFRVFGEICYIHQFPSGKNWGFVVYKTPAEAVQAAEYTRDDDSNVGELEHRRVAKHQADFKAKLFWCRRPCNGTAFIDISPAFMSECLSHRDFYVGEKHVTIKVSKKRPDESLFLSGVPAEVSEDLLRRSLLHALGFGENAQGIIDSVKIMRVKVDRTDKNELKRLQERLKEKITSKLRISTVEVIVWPPRGEETVRFSAEARFTDPIEGFNACQRLQGRLTVFNVPVDIEPIVSATLRIQRSVYEACQQELDKLMTGKLKNIETDIKRDKSDNWLLCLKADDMKSIVKARTYINDVIKGDILECSLAPALTHLLTPAGRKMLKEAEGPTKAYVCVDNRTRSIAVHGSSKARTEMCIRVNDYLDQVLSGTVEELTLRGSDRPPGLLKELINKYGEDLDTLREESGLLAVAINYRWHKLKLTGPPENLDKAKKAVEDVSSALLEACQQKKVDDEEELECVTCFCPIDSKDLYRLEACAHPYCKDCIKHQVSVAIKNHQLPVVCSQDGCDVPLAWRDFNSMSRLGHIKLSDLASSALSAYVLANRGKASFCTTPNCPMVYRVTSEEDAKTFQCPACTVRICTACQHQAHDGMTCAMLRSSKKEKIGVDEWVSQDPKNRKACPGCRSPIEKTGGCNRMTCDACKTVFCWICGKKSRSSTECYKHLTEVHGGVFDMNDPLYRF